MRQKKDPQGSIFHIMPRNAVAKELEEMSRILDGQPGILDVVHNDLVGTQRADTGRPGMTAEQVLRCAILKQYRQLTYEELAFHLEDSETFRAFARLGHSQSPNKSTLQKGIKAIKSSTWEAILRLLIGYALEEAIEKGRQIRLDSTAVETNVHYPTDSTLLQDGIRIITRLLRAGKDLEPIPEYAFSDHSRVVKKRVLMIHNAKKKTIRDNGYKDLLRIAERVVRYAADGLVALMEFTSGDLLNGLRAEALVDELEKSAAMLTQVMDQTERRVFRGEQVLSSEKLTSFFESHTDIIVKGRRETTYGHKVFLTGGTSGLVLDCVIERGNPADSAMFQRMIERHKGLYRRPLRQTAADGGFASKDNLAWAKSEGVKDVMFSKKRGLSVLAMVKSNWVYKKLRNFRAGIEANISTLKRAFGLDRCTWSGWSGFRQYVWSSVVSYNLAVLARLTSPVPA
jgi:IS5 family transposase